MCSHKTSLNIANQASLQPKISFKNRTLKQASEWCLRNAVQICHRIFSLSLSYFIFLFLYTRKRLTLTPIWKVRPSLHQLSRNSQMINGIMCRILTKNFTKLGHLVYKNSFTLPSKERLSLRPFALSSQSLNKFLLTSSALNFIQMGRKIYRGHKSLMSSSKIWL